MTLSPGDRIRYECTGDDGLPLVRYGFVGGVAGSDGPVVVINPRIVESDGEWTYEEGCLSVPGLSWEITRPNQIFLVGFDLEGNEISIETDEFEGRIFQHEMDHLDGILLVERLTDDQKKQAKKELRRRALDLPARDPDGLRSLFGDR